MGFLDNPREKSNIFYSGDTGYSEHFKEIGDKFGPFDVSFIENGRYDEQWRPVHVLPEEAAKAYFDLKKSKALVPVHWDIYLAIIGMIQSRENLELG